MNRIPQSSDAAAVLCLVHWSSGAVLAQFEPSLHRCVAGVAVLNARALQESLGIGRLPEHDAAALLAHLDPEVVAEHAQVAHAKHPGHLLLERDDLRRGRSGYDEVIHVNPDDQFIL